LSSSSSEQASGVLAMAITPAYADALKFIVQRHFKLLIYSRSR